MTTDNTQELDEIRRLISDEVKSRIYYENPNIKADAIEHHVDMIWRKLKPSVLDWHNKQINNFKGIIKMADKYTFDTGEVYYNQKAVDKQVEEVLDRLESQKATCYDCGHDNEVMATVPYIPVTAIEAERNKLKDGRHG